MKVNRKVPVNEAVLGTLGKGLLKSIGVGTPTPGSASAAAEERRKELEARAELGKESYQEFRNQKITAGVLDRFGRLIPSAGLNEKAVAQDAIRFAIDFFASNFMSVLGPAYLKELQEFIVENGAGLTQLAELPIYFKKIANRYNEIRDQIDKTLPPTREKLLKDLAAAINTLKPNEKMEITQQLKQLEMLYHLRTYRRR